MPGIADLSRRPVTVFLSQPAMQGGVARLQGQVRDWNGNLTTPASAVFNVYDPDGDLYAGPLSVVTDSVGIVHADWTVPASAPAMPGWVLELAFAIGAEADVARARFAVIFA